MNESSLPQFDLKEKVLAVLAFHKYTYSQLAEHLGTTEKELDSQFENNSLEVRTLELISKALRIPLYSFFREGNYELNSDEEQYYNIDIWGKDGIKLRTKLNSVEHDSISDKVLENLKKEIKEIEKLIHEIENKRKKE
jgi:transcriptional regulator with XRE-family HTH domain